MSSSSSRIVQFFIFSGILATCVEMCGNVNSAPSSDTAASTVTPGNGGNRKRRDVFSSEVVHIELLTTLTAAGDVEFARIENMVGVAYETLLANAHRQVADGVEGGKVLKYMVTNVDCAEAQLFASAIKDTTSFVTGGTVRCNDQITNF